MNIDWYSKEFHFFVNPRIPIQEKNRIESIANEFQLDSHIFLATSGSTAISSMDLKWVALKKSAILYSSQSVNDHLNCSQSDVLLNTLPYFHIGGLSLYSRAFLSGAKLIDIYSESFKWSPHAFFKAVNDHRVTITSLVPAQIFDIVNSSLKSPPFLRAIVIGGGALPKSIYERAKTLGWNLLPSYGMTECSSQVATASYNFNWDTPFPKLSVMKHLSLWSDNSGSICISGESLLSGYIMQKENKAFFVDPRKIKKLSNGEIIKYICTSDVGDVEGEFLTVFGRSDDVVKIGGENVNLSRLDEILVEIKISLFCICDMAVFAEEDERLGKKISIAFSNNENTDENILKSIISKFNSKVFPFERIREVYFLNSIPRTELGKLKRSQLSLNTNKNNLRSKRILNES